MDIATGDVVQGRVAEVRDFGAFVWLINTLQILHEEAALLEKFGDSYREYCGQVRRWV